MLENLTRSFNNMLENWETMKNSQTEDASEDADRFEQSFYRWIDELKAWLLSLDKSIKNVEQVKELPFINDMLNKLPDPLLLNYEIEIENIIDELHQ